MPLPSLIQTSETFNTWFDATNNLISHVSNTSVYVLASQNATPNTTTGNISLNGTMTTASLIANANVSFGGTTLASGVLRVTSNSTQGNGAVIVSGNTFDVSMTNVVFSGTDVSIAPNTIFQGTTVTINSTAVLTKNTSISSPLFVANSNASVNTITVAATNVLAILVNSTVATFSTNSTTFTANATNSFFTGTNLTISPNTVIEGKLTVNSQVIVNNALVINGNTTLGGTLQINADFVGNASANLSGVGTIGAALSVGATDVIFRVASDVANKVVSGIAQANTTQYRHLVVFNVGTQTILFEHANTTVGANAVLCPANTNAPIYSGGTCLLYYDANTSIQKWRVIASHAPDANSTVRGLVNTSTQTFAGDKTFQNAASFSNTVSITGNVTMSNTVSITGNVTMSNTVSITGNVTMSNTATITGNATFHRGMTVNNTIDLNTLTTSRLVLPVGSDKWST